MTRRRRIAGGTNGDSVRTCVVCAARVEGSAWTKIDEAIYHNRCGLADRQRWISSRY